MPLTCNIGLSKKIGLPDYCSLGASCSVQFELDATLLRTDLDAFQRSVHNAYVACAQAVNDELTRHKQSDNGSQTSSQAAEPTNGNATNGNQASQKQRDYIDQLARQVRGLGVRRLDALASKMFGKPLASLSSLEASGVIDTLKGVKDGSINLDEALSGATT